MFNTKPVTLLLARHGETELSKAGCLYGRVDVPLTEHGRRQAYELVHRLQQGGWRPKVLFSSPALRAVQTIEPLAMHYQLPVYFESTLWEQHYGDWEGKSVSLLRQEQPTEFSAWLAGTLVAPPNGETLAMVRGRVQDFIGKIRRDYVGETVLAVAHGSLLNNLLCVLLNTPSSAMWTYSFGTGCYAEVLLFPDHAVLHRLNT
jgi:broad specificity phosphatase PhoE